MDNQRSSSNSNNSFNMLISFFFLICEPQLTTLSLEISYFALTLVNYRNLRGLGRLKSDIGDLFQELRYAI